MKVSTTKIDITPSRASNPFLAGYGVDIPREVTSDESYAPLYARCIVIWDDDKPHAIVVADVLGFPRSMHQTIRQRVVASERRWASSDFILQATHTHNGPVLKDKLDPFISYNVTDVTLVNSYSNWLEDRIVTLVETALAAPQITCTLDYQVTSAGFAHNRAGLSYNETAVPILTARAIGGMPIAILFSYGCHPVSAGMQTQYDGDFPAGACNLIEKETSSFSMFILGPAGDQDPPNGRRGSELRERLSNQLSDAVLAAIQQPGRAVSGPIQTAYQEVDLPLDITGTPANLTDVQRCYETRQNSHPTGFYVRHASVMIQQIQNRTFETVVPLPIQVWKFQGDPVLRLAFTGGELVSGYGVYFRQRYGGAEGLLIGGYANEVPSYIPSSELLPPIRSVGSYEGGWDIDYPGIAGGSQTIYRYLGHYLAGAEGVESVVKNALDSLLK